MNKAILMGRMTADAELKRTPGSQKNPDGTSVCAFTLAVNRRGKDAGADFIDCVAWGKTAEFICKYFSKGQMMNVAGRIQTRTWEDKEGHKRKSTELVIEEVDFCESKSQNSRKESNQEIGDPMAPLGFAALPGDDGGLPF